MDKITGIGNALVDSLVHITDDAELERLKLPKGSMQLIDEQQYAALSREMNRLSPKCATGGSAANAMLALARLGRKPGFIGKTGDDEMGRFYAGTMSAAGADIHVAHSSLPTGVASTFISPDGQRTFATFLGAAATLEPADIRPEMIEGSRYLYLEGYLVQNHALIDRAVEIAKQVGAKICLDLASYNIVEQDRAYFERLVSGSVDIVFANEEESRAFTGLEPEAAAVTAEAIGAIGAWSYNKGGSLAYDYNEEVLYLAGNYNATTDTDHNLWKINPETGKGTKAGASGKANPGRFFVCLTGLIIIPGHNPLITPTWSAGNFMILPLQSSSITFESITTLSPSPLAQLS